MDKERNCNKEIFKSNYSNKEINFVTYKEITNKEITGKEITNKKKNLKIKTYK